MSDLVDYACEIEQQEFSIHECALACVSPISKQMLNKCLKFLASFSLIILKNNTISITNFSAEHFNKERVESSRESAKMRQSRFRERSKMGNSNALRDALPTPVLDLVLENKEKEEEELLPPALKTEEREHGTIELIRHLVQPVGLLSEHVGSGLINLGLSDSVISDTVRAKGHGHSWTYYLNALRLATRQPSPKKQEIYPAPRSAATAYAHAPEPPREPETEEGKAAKELFFSLIGKIGNAA